MLRLAIVTTHPVQYNAPLFKLINQRGRVHPKVFYTYGKQLAEQFDRGFNKNIKWDIPLLDGYEYEFVDNNAKHASLSHFRGIRNPDLINTIQHFSPHAIMVYGWNYYSHLQLMRHFKNKIPIFFRGDSTLLDEQGKIKTLIRRLALKYIYSFVDKAFYVGQNNKAYFLKHGMTEQDLVLAPHAIDNNRFAKTIEKDKIYNFRKENNIPQQATLLLFAGKFEAKKNPAILIEAFNKIKQKHIHLLMVGNGVQESILKQKAADNNNIHFIDFCNQSVMPLVYQSANVFVLPSSGPGETWGLAINEAMACGLAVVASNKVGGAIDLIKPGNNGYIFEANNTIDLLKALKNTVLIHDVLKGFKENSKRRIQKFTLTNISAAIEQCMLKNSTTKQE